MTQLIWNKSTADTRSHPYIQMSSYIFHAPHQISLIQPLHVMIGLHSTTTCCTIVIRSSWWDDHMSGSFSTMFMLLCNKVTVMSWPCCVIYHCFHCCFTAPMWTMFNSDGIIQEWCLPYPACIMVGETMDQKTYSTGTVVKMMYFHYSWIIVNIASPYRWWRVMLCILYIILLIIGDILHCRTRCVR